MGDLYNWVDTEEGKNLINWMKKYYREKIKNLPATGSAGAMVGKSIGDSVRKEAKSKGVPPEEAVRYFFQNIIQQKKAE
ncbi:hypothetical protein AKJ57_00950 [candidate division MSBL1 archaeon SCGC-AAA259A05]|uniref:Asn/Gln amidotransferase domain-containing protein n=1 Tax=candidate division MSBL1 archaeon SCGC-AAA259A05 TaxID=1698259 RepID=A0A133UBA7_9EURY|nr:hypothetical protein AKJ57_00950 [candidate division MSBL1 archaeon SCGC-AAA259A05]